MARWPYKQVQTLIGRTFRNDLNKNFVDIEADIKEQKTRVDELINSVEQPSEVVDARTSVSGQTYAVLKDRLDSEYLELRKSLDRISNVEDFGAVGDGVTDDTSAFQAALDKGGRVEIPNKTYLVGQLAIDSNTQLVGIGRPTLKHRPTGGFQSPFPRAMISNKNMPPYHAPSDDTREYQAGLNKNISIENIIFDGDGNDVYGIQMVATDSVTVLDSEIINTSGGLDLRAVRDSYFNLRVNNIKEDGISISDQNFMPLAEERGISTRVIFEKCLVENSCLVNTNEPPDANAYELDDGMSYIYYYNCGAVNNHGSGFEAHVHTSDYDVTDIHYINCYAINNTPSAGVTRTLAGFHLGQTPVGSKLDRIYIVDCTSIGSPNAFAGSPGSQEGQKGNVYIDGGYWEASDHYLAEVRDMRKSTMLLKKQFKNFHIKNAIIKGTKDGFGVYTYLEGEGLYIEGCTFEETYIAARLGHFEGEVSFTNNRITTSAPYTDPYSAFLYVNTKKSLIRGNSLVLNADDYSSSLIRLNGVSNAIVSGNLVENIGTKGNNAFQVDTCGQVVISENIASQFDCGVYLSNDSTSVIVSANSFKECNSVVSRPDAPFLILSRNADAQVNNPGWINATLQNGWQSFRTPRFTKNGNIVSITGAAKSGTIGSAIFTLPEGYRPVYAVTYIQYNSGTTSKTVVMNVNPTGEVTLSSSNSGVNTDFVPLDCNFALG
ncbi:right-handed parallel beta-helix repeat-containing protein [Bacillus haynesii]|uniref:right-handed parallel beta-helix repeat-containing protein n=1 Tax=Bacillus haynesii TaxID=1925021 RepID=UPI002281C815|nr:right-handed parallel beta-helix repeat-containing protein [Bacillus haynesii]MCY8754840.1 hypothetical protein [Bacillus haynesii]